jgi:glyoxylase-like metal-dependent hydrolase (beta-lactamase superfamily II)
MVPPYFVIDFGMRNKAQRCKTQYAASVGHREPQGFSVKIDLLIPGLPAKTDHFLFGICSLLLLLLRVAGRTILFDTGPFRVRPMLIAALNARGLAPKDIDTVFLTHLHWDHVENLDLFAHAEILTPRVEFEYAAWPRPNDWGTPPYVREILWGMNVTLLADEEQELFPGVRTGHSVGLQGLVIDNRGGARRARERRLVVGERRGQRRSGCCVFRSRQGASQSRPGIGLRRRLLSRS